MEYSKKIDEVINIINKDRSDVIIIGDNSSGKSEVLKKYLELGLENIYFIDSINRIFEKENLNFDINDIQRLSNNDILEKRLTEEYFNLKDSFIDTNIQRAYNDYKEEFLELLQDFFDLKINFRREKNKFGTLEINFYVEDKLYEKISSGFQALFRIFLEIIYASKDKKSLEIIVIDEMNEYLSAKNESKILPFLKGKFPNIRFIITTHSADVILSAQDTNLIVINENDYEIANTNDYKDNADVRILFNRIYFENSPIEKEMDKLEINLKTLFEKKINNEWSATLEEQLTHIESLRLNASQSLLLKEIKEW